MEYINIDLPPGLESAISAMEKKFILMRSSGDSIRDISKKLKKSTHTICDWNKKFAKEILNARNAEFCDLQKEVIESKTARLKLLKSEFNRSSNLLKRQKIDVNETFGSYKKFLELFVKLSELMSSCESDILSVGVKFKDNIEPEINSSELDKDKDENKNTTETAENMCNTNKPVAESEKKIIDNSELKKDEQQNTTNCNTATAKKYQMYKKQ
jgi:hypothetical protein